MVTVLSWDAFIDTLEDQQVQIYVKQVHPADVQQALVRAMEFEAFLYTIAAAVTAHHCFVVQKLPRYHLPVHRTQVQQGRMRRTSSAEDMLTGGCASTFSHQGLLRELWTVGASLFYLLTAEESYDGGGKRQQAGSSSHCPAKSSPDPIFVKCLSDTTVLAVRVLGAVDGCLCPLVVDTSAAKTFIREEVVAVQNLPMSDRQLCGVTGHCTML
ncbi:hypothetical protein E2C01_046091 [Portunus trituberculatus]|uniref:Uncharacterized protein n=1 Tax=Portunus trituberculatus TaxID=210409 RepID=A0A5B7G4W1_PORTR|nr:hypothetical protein [Portunus trituberculatus]